MHKKVITTDNFFRCDRVMWHYTFEEAYIKNIYPFSRNLTGSAIIEHGKNPIEAWVVGQNESNVV